MRRTAPLPQVWRMSCRLRTRIPPRRPNDYGFRQRCGLLAGNELGGRFAAMGYEGVSVLEGKSYSSWSYDIIYRCKIEVVLTAPETRYFTFSGWRYTVLV